ncbi:MAG: hypothetical protein SVC26_06430 [Pseudomonadota bacterium]|nr:hypothetical protein [Pseudomonadota bacterium]
MSQVEKKPSKWRLYLLILIALAFFGAKYHQEPTSTPKEMPLAQMSAALDEAPADNKATFIGELTGLEKAIKEYKVPQKYNEPFEISLDIALFSAWVKIIQQGETLSLSPEESTRLNKAKQAVKSIQAKAFPKMRDDYGPILRRELWEHDLSAKTYGTGMRKIKLVGGAFAANRNIKQMQDTLNSVMHMLRFKQSLYQWYDGSDTTYYDLKSLSDTDLAVWTGSFYTQ